MTNSPNLDQSIGDGSGHNQQAGRDIVNLTVNLPPTVPPRAASVLNAQLQSPEMPSTLARVVSALTQRLLETGLGTPSSTVPYAIHEKIRHNDLKEFRVLVARYGEYAEVLDQICTSLDRVAARTQQTLYAQVSNLYLRCQGVLCAELAKDSLDIMDIRAHSDRIMEWCSSRLAEIVALGESDDPSAIRLGTDIVVCCAFIDCRILEPPPSAA